MSKRNRRRGPAAEISRRRLLQVAAAAGGALTFGGLGPIERAFAQDAVLPRRCVRWMASGG